MDAKTILKKMTLEEKAAFCSGRDYWHTKAIERLGVPDVMMCDGPHGLRKQLGEGDHLGINKSIETVCYPSASALASSFDRQVMRKLGEALGEECQAEAVSMLLGPGLNIKRSPLCGRNFEYFSEDPYLAGELGSAYVESLQKKGIAACVKHFACNNQETKRMTGDSVVDERTLHEIYLAAFENVVKKGGTRGVMCAYNAVNGEFCAENKTLLTDVLREQWGYTGFVVTDWGAVKDRAKGISAGLDLEMPGGPNATGEELVKAVKDGSLSETELDRSVFRILEFVLKAAEEKQENVTIDRENCRRISRELSGECAVLLRNENVLPLCQDKRVAFIGEFAQNPRYQGAGSSHINVPHAVSALEAVKDKNVIYARGYDMHMEEGDPDLVNEAIAVAADVDIAVIFAGLPDAFEIEGCDRQDMQMPKNQSELIHKVAEVNKNTVVVLYGGAPVELEWREQVAGILCMYLGGEQTGAATVDVLYGTVNLGGHLAETWPVKLADNPSFLNFPGEDGVVTYAEGIYAGYRYYDKKEMQVAYPFGFGLSYTDFEYHNLRIDRRRICDTDTMLVQCDVTNTGSCFGKTVMQLYVRDVESTVRRPIRELKGFEKIALDAGETKTVSFVLDKCAFAYYEPRCKDWFVESGEFVIEIGKSSREICQSITVYVEGTIALPFIITENTTIGQLMKHPKGAEFVKKMMASGSTANTETMGEGSEKMVQQMVLEMPLGALVSYGRMTKEQLEGTIHMLNS